MGAATLPRATVGLLLAIAVTSLNGVISSDVTTTDGKLVGFKQYVDDERHIVDTFLGIPYARPPVGDLRFKPPIPGPPWDGERSARYLPNCCLQVDYSANAGGENSTDPPTTPLSDPLLTPTTKVSEDCLYLNVWVPRHDRNRTLPALVWLHGGMFTSGSASSPSTDGAYMAALHGVIVVSINYRLGVAGFFYTGSGSSRDEDADSPGNLGLMDQKLALKWIYNNVENFRGSRRHITIFGTDAGAASAGLHLLSPRSWPYFSRAVLQSGSPLSEPWALAQPEVMRKRSLEVAALAGCDADSGGDLEGRRRMMKCMRGLSKEKLLEAQREYGQRHGDVVNGFVPVLDGDVLPDDPATLLRAGKAKPVPLLIGVNKNDGLQTLLSRLPEQFPARSAATIHSVSRDVFVNDVIPTFLPTVTPTRRQLDTLERLYTDQAPRGARSDPASFFNASESLVADVAFRCDVINFAKFFYVRSDVYLYSFEHASPAGEDLPGWLGAKHYAEVAMLFGKPFKKSVRFTMNEMALSKKMMELWTNFAKFGSPNIPRSNPVWPRFATNTLRHLVLDARHGLTTQTRLRQQQCSFLGQVLPSMQGDVTDPGSHFPESPASAVTPAEKDGTQPAVEGTRPSIVTSRAAPSLLPGTLRGPGYAALLLLLSLLVASHACCAAGF